MKADDQLVSIDVLMRVRMAILAHGLIRESCIASVAIWIATLKNLCVKAEPVCVKVAAINAPLVEWLKAHHTLPKDEAGRAALKATGAASVEVGFHVATAEEAGNSGRGWNGHLVVGIRPREGRGSGFLVDLSIDAAHRPEKGIHLQNPVVVPVPARVWPFALCGQTVMRSPLPAGGQIEYVVVPGDASYGAAPDWAERKTRWRALASELAASVRGYGTKSAPALELPPS